MIQWKFCFSAPLVPQREQVLQSLLCLSRDAIPQHHCQALLFPSKASGFISVSCVWTERVALTSIHHHVWNRELAGSCSVAQGAGLGWVLGGDRGQWDEGQRGLPGVGYVYTQNGFALLDGRSWHGIVKQVYSNNIRRIHIWKARDSSRYSLFPRL